MFNSITSRQNQILKLLLTNRDGLTIDEVSQALDISRSAVQQHFSSLESNQFITPVSLTKTAGRPVKTYIITEKGINHFPKQYAWFSEIILSDLKQEMGDEKFKQYLARLGHKLAAQLQSDFNNKPLDKRLEQLIATMDSLGFQASMDNKDKSTQIQACNCIYHDIAKQHPEICEFDRTLISQLLDQDVELNECMAKGGKRCRFIID